ncbi:Na+/H+ antiporter subunit G [Corynebacterium capitovis]|uniref:Na+/H+ antiporter subunit G n=1 Tax=Corynebacterium capitovis TaxID=131081 RepID=UPI000477549A
MTLSEIIVALLVVAATIFTVATAVLQLRAPDALTRANLLGPLVCLAFPLLIVAKLIRSWATAGFDVSDFLRALLSLAGVWIIASVASFVIGRSIYGFTVVDKVPPEMGAES